MSIRRRAAFALAPAAAVLLASGSAAAQQQAEEQWYGWQTLIALGTSYGVVGVGAAADVEWLAGIGVLGYLVAPPVVHLAHGEAAKAGGSLALHVGLPVATGLLGYGIVCGAGGCSGELGFLGALGGFMLGGVVGMAAANIIDVAALAYEEVPAGPGAASSALGARPAGPAVLVPVAVRF